jgi:hypothetical protein
MNMMKYYLKTPNTAHYVVKAKLVPRPGYLNHKDVEYEFESNKDKAILLSKKEAEKWVNRFKEIEIEVVLETKVKE